MLQSILSSSIRAALLVGAIGAAGAIATAYGDTVSASGQLTDQQQPASKPKKKTQTLQQIVVTGSRIPTSELQTSNPVVTISAEQIQKMGKLTIGSVIQNLPQITGSVHTGNLDFGGNTGGSFLGLRGLGASRTLTLIDGQRIQGETNQNVDDAVDLNAIPATAVERIEVLTDGASAIYGSDAIGGVVNVILKKHFTGAELSTNYGISADGDGQTIGSSFMFGHSYEKGNFVAAISYNKFDPVLGSQRKFSRDMRSLSTTSGGKQSMVLGGKTTYGPEAEVSLPPNLQAKFGCANPNVGLALTDTAYNAGTSPVRPGDYSCFEPANRFNLNSILYLVTPQQRTNFYFYGDFDFTKDISGTLTVLHEKTDSEANSNPPPFGTETDPGVTVSKDSFYNPFGIDFSTSGSGNMTTNFDQLGPAVERGSTTNDYILAELKGHGHLFGHPWTWGAGYNFSHISLTVAETNLVNNVALQAGAGPSFLNANGVVQCGTPSSPISLSSCTPWDPFNPNGPSTRAILAQPGVAHLIATNNTFTLGRIFHVDAEGGIVDLPAGTLSIAVGASYRKVHNGGANDPALFISPTGTCSVSGSCTGAALEGGFSVKEAYGELSIPVLRDLPGVHSLKVSLGGRYSRYSDFGSTANSKLGIAYRPTADLLLRGTVSTVFRAPTVQDLFGQPFLNGNALTSDPCTFVAPTKAASNPFAGNPACAGVPATGTFIDQAVLNHTGVNALTSGASVAGFKLQPETGSSFDFGAVWSPHFVPGLSLTADIWRIYIKNLINSSTPQTELTLCFDGETQFCPLIHRVQAGTSAGSLIDILTPVVNLGRIDVKGVDFSAAYRFALDGIGNFSTRVTASYMSQWKAQTAPGTSQNIVSNGAGLMAVGGTPIGSACPDEIDFGTCYFPRVRGQMINSWSRGSWSAEWRVKFLGRFGIPDAPEDTVGVDRYGATVYNDVTVGYDFKSIKTVVNFGVNNVFNRQPPILFVNRVPEENVDTNDFDVLGRYYWASAHVRF